MNVRRQQTLFAFAFVALGLVACGSSADSPPTAAPGTCAEIPAPQKPAAACEVTLEAPPLPAQSDQHVPENTQVAYCSNPPSGGPHYPVWADFKEYTRPIDAPYLVHSLEHGAVILYWKCTPVPGAPPEASCPERADIVAQLRKVRDEAAPDPACTGGGKRIIIAPSTTITTDVAAAAWGATYHAPCVDLPSLGQFVRDHYAKAPEDFCIPGRSF